MATDLPIVTRERPPGRKPATHRENCCVAEKLSPPPPRVPPETLAAEAVTVGWVLSAMTTLLCELGALAGWLYAADAPGSKIAVLTALLCFASLVFGAIGLAMLPIVLKLRKSRPPRVVTLAVILIHAAPLIAGVVVKLW